MTATWFITGASSGMGRELTTLLLARGDRVAATARSADRLDDLLAAYPDHLWVRTLDVTDTTAVKRVIGEAFSDLERVDVIVNNAGYGLFGAAEELTDEQLHRQIDTNLVASIEVIRAALPHLREQGGGTVVQFSSQAGQMAFPWLSLYCATKWGIEGFCEALRMEVEPFGIHVLLVEPGTIKTNFLQAVDIAPRHGAYDDTPAGEIRRMVEAGEAPELGDPIKMCKLIVGAVDSDDPPRRLSLGSDSYDTMHVALRERLAELESQKELAYSTDIAYAGDTVDTTSQIGQA